MTSTGWRDAMNSAERPRARAKGAACEHNFRKTSGFQPYRIDYSIR
jgi:hypothetical protein